MADARTEFSLICDDELALLEREMSWPKNMGQGAHLTPRQFTIIKAEIAGLRARIASLTAAAPEPATVDHHPV